MTLYGVGLGPGQADLVTVRGKRALEAADVVYSPGRLSRSVATKHVPEDRIGDLDFPMTRDEEKLRTAWKDAAAEIAPTARDGDAAFVTLGDPNVYSTFGHLRRTMAAFHPEVELEVVPGVSAVTAFATALGVEVTAGSSLALREADGGVSPTGPDRMILFKVTDAPATHEGLVEAGYDVTYGRRLFMEQGETVVTADPTDIDERDYYTLAYAERPDARVEQATDAFLEGADEAGVISDGGKTSIARRPSSARSSDGGETSIARRPSSARSSDGGEASIARQERSEGAISGDETGSETGGGRQ